MSDLRMKFS